MSCGVKGDKLLTGKLSIPSRWLSIGLARLVEGNVILSAS
jgi:hypothetical protein